MSFQDEINKIKLILSNQQKVLLVDASGYPTSSPDKVDTISATIIYEGWSGLSLIRKTDLSVTDIITRTWATGTWANRTTLTYS
jgi:hypothetical protein